MTFAVSSTDFHYEANNKAHHTSEITGQRLILRRGQAFTITLNLHKGSQPEVDKVQLIAETGPSPSEASGTRAVFRVSGPPVRSSWSAAVQNSSSSSVTLSVTSPANASIGKYSLKIQVAKGTPQISALGEFILLFNPWCADDSVHMQKDNEKQEYVMNEQGLLYRGCAESFSPSGWNFGQFEEDIVDICLKLLDVSPDYSKNPGLDCSRRSDPTYVGRVVSAMVNCNGDRGILLGRWDNDYSGGTPPTRWTGSVEILRQWSINGCRPVKYGQCWVYAAVMCTVMRCLGIPTRVITNFDSAHDTDGNLTIDEYYSISGQELKLSSDSIWNFHVWVESWMARSDLPAGYDGWQVLDPTPQEKSEGVYCCGPAPVKAILEGDTDIKHDVPFVFAEVNADKVRWVVGSDGSKQKSSSSTRLVGSNISTKAVGTYAREDVTHLYKYPEGSKTERDAFARAVRKRNGISDVTPNGPDAPKPPASGVIELSIKLQKTPVNGEDITFYLRIVNRNQSSKNLSITTIAQALRHNGRPEDPCWKNTQSIKIGANGETKVTLLVPYSKYGASMMKNDIVKLTAVANEEGSNEMHMTEKDVLVTNPTLSIEVKGTPVLYQEFKAEITFTNTLSETLRNCLLTLSGTGLIRTKYEIPIRTLGPNRLVRVTIPLTPTKPGSRMLTADFDCNLFRDVKAYKTVEVKRAY
ncbi:protein-glutamine gamma-glutamyltransferase 5-like [Acipenser oxyrinchus oxyrinchus]|uniref:protein-glutamine gamma-glutamyltransferase n=1 Tax=Acipenser oxyrinchus oxyrinchus TaxID=40147 RepID=A0AAD8FZL3_ACIOX|nr:protein-glutamine gamma-glutamyltransferase 5-like [Acipenser oxyrinchus oxyrinchus]